MKIALLALALIPMHSYAEKAVIHEMKSNLIKLEDGRVVYFSSLIETPVFYPRGTKIEIDLNESNEILRFETSEEKSLIFKKPVLEVDSPAYAPTIFPTYSSAQNSLNGFRFPDAPGSQCYDRAHIWTFEAERFYGNRFSKMWLFFSDHYIEANRYKWWFHVAPVTQVDMKGLVENRIMDRAFARFPMKLKLWTDLFMYQKQECKQVSLYTDYSLHPNEDDCYLIESTPYFWQPRDLEQFAKRGVQKSRYIESDVSHAYKNGFGISQ